MFPDGRQPCHSFFAAIYRRVVKTGSMAPQTIHRGRHSTVCRWRCSRCQVTLACRTSHSNTWSVVFQEKLLYPYHLQRVSVNTEELFPIVYCTNWRSSVCHFSLVYGWGKIGRHGITNLYNQHLWADRNSHGKIQDRTSISLWFMCGLKL